MTVSYTHLDVYKRQDYARTPELLGLYGASLALMGRGREALEILNSPELMQDAASHLWAALAAEAIGDPTEARKQFQLGVPALAAFSPQMQAQFKLNEAEATYYLGAVSYTHLDVYKRQALQMSL